MLDKIKKLMGSEDDLEVNLSEHILRDLLLERRADRRWRFIKRSFFALLGLVIFAAYAAVSANRAGFKLLPLSDYIAVVNVSGAIGEGQMASAEKIVPALERAFSSERVKAVALNIDSPGGQPFEAERVGQAITRLKTEHPKPVYAFIGNTGASAAYLLALNSDRIIAGKYSLVGSIGAIINGWDFHELAEKWHIKQTVFESGVHKSMLNPFVAMSDSSKQKAQQMVDTIAKLFLDDFKNKRKGKLQENFNYSTGEVWNGEEALRLGLIDEIGTIESVANKELHLPVKDIGPSDPTGRLFSSLGSSFADGLISLFIQ